MTTIRALKALGITSTILSTSRRYGYIAGTVQIEDTPARRWVRCFIRQSGRLVAETFSGQDGSYRFDNLDTHERYLILAQDYELQFNAVVADNVTPVPGKPEPLKEELLAPAGLDANYDSDTGTNTLTWRNLNFTQEAVRVYRSDEPLDPDNLPTPLAELGAFVSRYEDDTVIEGETYYYRVGVVADGGSVEVVSEELESEALPLKVYRFNDIDLSSTPDNYDQQIADTGAEMVATFRDGAIAEDSVQVSTINDWGQHKWPQDLTADVRQMWILARNNATGEVLHVYAQRDTPAAPNTVITEAATWTFEAAWQGELYTGTGTWRFSDNMGGSDFSTTSLSGDDGAWAFMDGVNTQGDQSRPGGDLFGVGNWNAADGNAVMSALGDDFGDFQGIVIVAPDE